MDAGGKDGGAGLEIFILCILPPAPACPGSPVISEMTEAMPGGKNGAETYKRTGSQPKIEP